jgi:hypothetical protein
MPPCVLVNPFVGFWQKVRASILSDKLRAVKRGISEGIYLVVSAVVETVEKDFVFETLQLPSFGPIYSY